MKPIRCSGKGCNALLTSPRSIRLGIGQRCKWKRDGRPTRKRSSNVSQGMPISDEPFVSDERFIRDYVQTSLGDWD